MHIGIEGKFPKKLLKKVNDEEYIETIYHDGKSCVKYFRVIL